MRLMKGLETARMSRKSEKPEEFND